MIWKRAVALAVAIGCCSPLIAQDSLPELRAKFNNESPDGISGEELDSLSAQALELATTAGERGDFWSALGFVAELCEAGPHEQARSARAQALALLVQRYTDTRRWSALLTYRFVPALERIPRTAWDGELEAYDETLNRLLESTSNEQIQAALLYARVMPRIRIDRSWDWLTDAVRSDTVRQLNVIRSRFGDLPAPGSRGQGADTVGDLASRHIYELEKLHFNAQAPATAGTDLEGKSLDLADFDGKIVILDFWTSFCAPCLAMVPGTLRLLARFSADPVVYVGVNGDSTPQQGLSTAQRLNMSWRSLWDGQTGGPQGPLADAWSVTGWPAVFVLDGAGRIRYKLSGEDVDQRLEPAIQSLLAELGLNTSQ